MANKMKMNEYYSVKAGDRVWFTEIFTKKESEALITKTERLPIRDWEYNPKGIILHGINLRNGEEVVVNTFNFISKNESPQDHLFFFTFGGDERFPYRYGHLIVRAQSLKEAFEIFRAKYPDRDEDKECLNCAFWYNEADWLSTAKDEHMGKCHEVMTRSVEDYAPVVIFVPAKNELLCIQEGTGDNLLKEDTEAGYVDYIYYDTYDLSDGMVDESDGGEVMLKELFRNKYSCTMDCIPDVLDMAYDDSTLKYIVLEEEVE